MRLLSSGVFSGCRPFNNLQERGTTEVINKFTILNNLQTLSLFEFALALLGVGH